MAGFLIAGLFIAPFMLFSATSGQLADKLEKSWLIRRVKDAEVGVMLIGGAGLALIRSAPQWLAAQVEASSGLAQGRHLTS